jgi:ribose transport system permease protein/erythritol transport system permease protein
MTAEPVRRREVDLRALARQALGDRAALLALMIVVVITLNTNLVVDFFTLDNIAGSTEYAVEVGILALAQLIVIVTGRGAIDLSVGAMVSLASVMLGGLAVNAGLPLVPAVVLTVLGGALLGAVNGFFVAYVRFPALIVTLATLNAYSAIALATTDTVPISDLPEPLYDLAGRTGVFPTQTLFVFLPVALLVWLVLSRTAAGRYVYGVGTNARAARFAGAPVAWTRFWAFVASGALAGVVAVITSARFASARPDAGAGLELQAITIAVLGGVAVTGGVGTVPGVVLAALLVALINNGFNLGGVDTIYQQGTLGLILIGSALLNEWLKRRQREGG